MRKVSPDTDRFSKFEFTCVHLAIVGLVIETGVVANKTSLFDLGFEFETVFTRLGYGLVPP